MKQLLPILALIVAIPFPAFSASRTLTEYRAIYEREMAKIEADDSERKKADEKYLNALNEFIEKFKKAADFKNTSAAMAERKRFRVDASVPSQSPPDQPSLIVTLQAQYRDILKRIDAKKLRTTLSVSERYMNVLNLLMAELLEAEEMATAKDVNGEIERVKFIVDDASALLPAPPQRASEKKETPRPARRRSLPAALRKGLVLHYTFDKDEKGKVTDKSGKKNHGEIQGARWIKDGRGMRNGACNFDGQPDRIVIGAPDIPEPWTAALWLKKRPSANSKHAALFDSERYSLRLEQNMGRHGNTKKVGFTKYRVADHAFDYTVPVETWGHLVFSGDDRSTTLSINGLLHGTVRQSVSCPMSTVGGHGIYGLIDEVMIYNRALSEKEIRQLYKATGGELDKAPERRRGRAPSDAISFRGHHYKRVVRQVSWEMARTACEDMGGYLACISSPKENSFVADLADGMRVWLGGSDASREGRWEWVNGQKFDFAAWLPGEPNNGNGREDYLELKNGTEWNDIPGGPDGNTTGFICEWNQ